MKKKEVVNGRLIIYVPQEKNLSGMTWVVAVTRKRIYRCDAHGNIYSCEKNGGERRKMTVVQEAKDRSNPSPRVIIEGKKKRVDVLIANEIFYPMKIDKNDIGHRDGDRSNNAVTNLYIDITPMEPTEEIEK